MSQTETKNRGVSAKTLKALTEQSKKLFTEKLISKEDFEKVNEILTKAKENWVKQSLG